MFSKDIYKKQNGFLFVVLSWVMFFFFLMLVIIIFMPKQINYPSFLENYANFLSIFLGSLCMVGFVGFPLSICLYVGMKKLFVNSKLNINDGKIYYIQQVEAFWTIFGRSTKYKIYNVLDIKNYDISRRWIKVYGEIEEQVVCNKNKSGKTDKEYVKIARAFDTDKQIIAFLEKLK